jgi:predicted permease
MGIPLRRGRFFTSHDDEHSALVAVIDEAFARKYYPNQDPVGKRLNLDMVGAAEIVGVVGHIRQWGLDAGADRFVQAQIHVPVLQTPDKFMPMVARGMTVVVRTNGSPLAIVPSIRQVVGQMNSEQVMYNVQTMDTIISWSLGDRRFSMILLALFASLALILASVGLYGVISYTVVQRTREIGIRIALGARQHDVLGSVLGQGAKVVLLGVAIGIAASLALARLMSSMLYGVGSSDPLTFLGVAVLLMLVAMGACYIPARRAMHVDPVIALRHE